MKIAQVVITKTIEGRWKITAQSLNKTEVMLVEPDAIAALAQLDELFNLGSWEQLSIE